MTYGANGVWPAVRAMCASFAFSASSVSGRDSTSKAANASPALPARFTATSATTIASGDTSVADRAGAGIEPRATRTSLPRTRYPKRADPRCGAPGRGPNRREPTARAVGPGPRGGDVKASFRAFSERFVAKRNVFR